MTRTTLKRITRYGLIGLATNLVGYCAYLLIVAAGLSPKTSLTITYVTAATLSYLGNRRLTFDHDGSVPKSAVLFAVTHACGWALNLLLLFLLVDLAGLPHQLVQAVAILVVAGFLFISFTFVVFPKRR